MKVDDPVGAISVHGTNGLWGVISVGLFADGKSNYGGSWNGVTGSVTGPLLWRCKPVRSTVDRRRDSGGFCIYIQLRREPGHRQIVGQQGFRKAELEGLDIPEMGQLGYPEFELKARDRGDQ